MSLGVQGDSPAQDTSAPSWRLLRRATRYWRTGAVALAVGLAVTVGAVAMTKRVYQSETVVLYRPGAREGYGEVDSSRRAGARLQDMLFARERLQRVRKELNLFPGYGNPMEAVEEMAKATEFKVRDGSTFTVKYQAESPELAQLATRRLAETLIEDNARQRREEADENKRFIDQEKKRSEEQLREREGKLTRFLVEHPQHAADQLAAGGVGRSLAPEPTVDSTGSVLGLELQLEDLRARLASARSAVVAPGAPRAASAPAEGAAGLARAEADLVAAERDLADKRERYTELHPDYQAALARVKQAQAAVSRARAAMAAERGADKADNAAPATAEVSPEAASLRNQIAIIEQEIGRARRSGRPRFAGDQKTLVAAEVEFQRLTRDVAESRERLKKLDDKQFQADLLATLESNEKVGTMVIVDPAYLPATPVKDNRKKVGLALGFMSLVVAFGAAISRAAIDDRVYEANDIELLTNFPVLSVVPRGGLLGEIKGEQGG